ncbi:hypothetical protein RPMA_22020 [Tardiphaga alba]|uniref:Outer membrane autotransporter protein n=1 Tax=Tardiphaga alba TaxID=340268 RepID=A0ABX8ABS4_9BRAD|nr:hypothetical protein [Tardiphaga alba]QUS41221.1 hypothetical protein RPMA_22020 [Tardiphaga alba]
MAVAIIVTALSAPAMAQNPTQNPWSGINDVDLHDLAPPPGEIEPVDTSPMPKADASDPDWAQLDGGHAPMARGSLRERKSSLIVGKQTSSWNSNDSNGASAVSVKQSVTPFWDTRIGADMNVARQSAPRSAQDAYRNQFGDGTQVGPSSGSAWAAMTAPGVASIWDQTSIEARVDPGSDQTKLGTSLSKSLPIAGNQYSLTLQSGYNIIQQGSIPLVGYNGRPTRTYETDQLARFNISETGTSFIAGQSLATTDDKWLRKVGAEQKLFGGVNISGSMSETVSGVTNKSLTAGFRHSW